MRPELGRTAVSSGDGDVILIDMVDERLERIEINPRVMLGKPVVRGTRITVEILLEKIAAGCTIEEILYDYPRLTREDVLAAVAYARQVVSTDEILPRIRVDE